MKEHGGDIYRYLNNSSSVMDFSANVNAFLDTGALSRYPELSLKDLQYKIMKYTGTKTLRVMLGPGLTYFIYKIPVWFGFRRSLVITPNFNEYEASLAVSGSKVSSLSLNIIKKNPKIIRSYRPDSLFLCSPVNPTGDIVDVDLIEEISEEMNRFGGILFVDQAFGDFVPDHSEAIVRLAEKTDNIIIGRSLTKILAIPALRIGYVLISQQLFSMIKDMDEPWSICGPAIDFVRKVDLNAIREKTILHVNEERSYVMEELKKMGLEIIGNPRANFIAFRTPSDIDLKERLISSGILIRDLSEYVDLGRNCYRIAIRTRSENRRLLNAIADAMASDNLRKIPLYKR